MGGLRPLLILLCPLRHLPASWLWGAAFDLSLTPPSLEVGAEGQKGGSIQEG